MHFKLSRVANHKREAPSSTSTSSASLIKESPTLDTVVTTDDETESKLPPLDVEALTEAFAAKPASGFFSFHRGSGSKGENSEDSEEEDLALKELPSDVEDSSSTDELQQKPKHERNTSSGFFSFKLNRGSTSGTNTPADTPVNVDGLASADGATEIEQDRDVELKDDVVEPQEQIEVVPREDDSLSPSSSKQTSGFFSFKRSISSPATVDTLNSKLVTVSVNTSVDNSSHSLKKEDQEEKESSSSNSSVVEEVTSSVMKTEKQSSGWLSFSKKKRTEASSNATPVEKIDNNDEVSVLSEGVEEEPTDDDIDEFLQAPLPEEMTASATASKPEKQSSGLFSFRKKGRAPSPDRGSSPTNTVETTPASPPETPNIAEELAESVLVEDPFDILQEMVPPTSKPSKSSSFFSFKLKSSSASNRKKLSKQENHIPARARSKTEDTVSTLPDDLSIKTDDMSIKTISVQSPEFLPVTPNLKNQKNGNSNDSHPRSGRYRKTRNLSRRNDHNMEPTVLYSPGTSTKPHDAPMTKNDLYFALDCEMVGVGDEGLESALARVCVVNWENQVVLDTFVKVKVPITDYRTYVSGVTQEDVESQNAMAYEDVRATVKNIIKGKILIGHALENDLNALKLTHPYSDTRDSATYAPFMREGIDQASGKMAMRPRKLRDLAWECLDRPIQKAGVAHSPIEDAVAALDLYKSVRNDWEKKLAKESLEKSRQAEEEQRMRMYNMYAAQQSHQQQQQHQQAMAYNSQVMQHHLQHSPHHSPAVAAGYNAGMMPGYHNQGGYHHQAHQAHQHYGMQPRTPTPQSRFGFVPVYNRQRRNRGSRNARNRQQDNTIPPQNLYVNSMSMQ